MSLPEGLPRRDRGLSWFARARILVDPAAFVDFRHSAWTGDARADPEGKQPRHFRADNQDPAGRPADLERAISGDPGGDLPADRIAAWLPLDRSVNINLVDGQRNYNLTRLVQGANQPRRTEVHVLSGMPGEWPRLFGDQWPLLGWGTATTSRPPPPRQTPPGMVLIRVHQPKPDLRCTFTLDPARDFIAVRQVVWSDHSDRWHPTPLTFDVRYAIRP